MNNPYCLTFGKEPYQLISRYVPFNEIIRIFTDEAPSQHIYMITGVRGSGKTVFMNSIAKELREDKDWIIIELNSSGDLLEEMAQKLYYEPGMNKVFKESGISLSFSGIGVEFKKKDIMSANAEIVVEKMLEKLNKKKKRVLITIDEAVNTKEMRLFASAFQIFVRKDLPLFLLMTGLYENINILQNEKNLTFLYRAPKIYLLPLNMGSMADIYEKTLKMTSEKALMLAKETKGYSFAFQVIGYFCFAYNGDYEKAKREIRQYLDDYVYEKIWAELPEKEKKIVTVIAVDKLNEVAEIKERLELKPNEFSVFRDRLIKKGIVDGRIRGRLEIALPFLDYYIREHEY